MIELTGADVEAIGRIIAKYGSRIMYECDEDIYRAGIVAGIERAAKHMESESTNTAIKIRSLLK